MFEVSDLNGIVVGYEPEMNISGADLGCFLVIDIKNAVEKSWCTKYQDIIHSIWSMDKKEKRITSFIFYDVYTTEY